MNHPNRVKFLKTLTIFCGAFALNASAGVSSSTVVEKCLAKRNCAYHLVGIASPSPYLQFSVMAGVARTWSRDDWSGAVEQTKKVARWSADNPREALARYDGIPESAPFYPRAVHNIEINLQTFSVGTTSERKTRAPRKGVPGWLAENTKERDNLPIFP